MALLHDILKWSETLPSWQRDALRRLLQKDQGLEEKDYVELYSQLKVEHGFSISAKLSAEPLASEHLPAGAKTGETVTLRAMRELKHVNRIPKNQILTISETGITIIYGGNSTGKSGYARVLKRACRARDQSERVLPDAYDRTATNAVPSARFEINYNGAHKEVLWIDDEVPPAELSTIAVFDSRCARSYLTAEQDVAYLPYGLDIVENLANNVLPELSRRLDVEIASIDVNDKTFEHLRGESEVGNQIENLTSKSDPAEIKRLGTFTEEDKRRLLELNTSLAEADPATKSKELRLSASRLKELGDRVLKPLAWVDGRALRKLQELDERKSSAEEAERNAAEALQAGETLLSGTGEKTWKLLFDAAKKYSTLVAYPGHEFPHTEDNSVCLLCQQPLSVSGRERLRRFEQYIKDDVAKTAKEQRQKFEAAKVKIEQADLRIGLDNALKEEIQILDNTLLPMLATFENNLENRRKFFLQSLDSHDWSKISGLVENPRTRIRKLAAHKLRASRVYAHASDEERKRKLTIKQKELAARQDLFKNLDAVLALLQRLQDKAALEKCIVQLKTRPISDKSKELASKAVSKELKKALDQEFKALDVNHIRTILKGRTERGRMLYRLVLDLPTVARIEQILSEGEQRAIAIGSFLAELSLADHSGGIVLDDPVSSLDHWRRKKVAKRLVQEASRRQVIVFTHDTSFLGQLRDEIDESGTPHSIMFLE